jgi:P-type Ca2+ transporter type 2C
MAHVLAIRSGRESLFRVGVLSNRPLLGAVALTFVLQLAAVYAPFIRRFLETEALPLEDFALALLLSTVVFWGVEAEKWLMRRGRANNGRDPDSEGDHA